jgi:hypothetical protein
MYRRGKSVVLVLAAALTLVLVGCGTFFFAPRAAPRNVPMFNNGQVVDITGRVGMDRNQITLRDLNSPALFRFVGLKPAEQKALSGLAGKATRVRLRVISSPSPNNYNAQFVQFATR